MHHMAPIKFQFLKMVCVAFCVFNNIATFIYLNSSYILYDSGIHIKNNIKVKQEFNTCA